MSRPDPPWSAEDFAHAAWHGEVGSAGSPQEQARGSRGGGTEEQSGTAPAGDGSAWRGTAWVCSAHLAASTRATQKKETHRASWTHRTEYSSSSSQVCPTSAESHLVSLYIHCKPVLSLSPGFDTPGKPIDFHNRSNEQAPRYWHGWF